MQNAAVFPRSQLMKELGGGSPKPSCTAARPGAACRFGDRWHWSALLPLRTVRRPLSILPTPVSNRKAYSGQPTVSEDFGPKPPESGAGGP